MADTTMSPAPSKALIFARRAGSTLFLWALVASVFFSRWSWAYLGFIGVLAIIATVEYFRMLREAGVKCFPRFGILIAVAYCGISQAFYLAGKSPPDWLGGGSLFSPHLPGRSPCNSVILCTQWNPCWQSQ